MPSGWCRQTLAGTFGSRSLARLGCAFHLGQHPGKAEEGFFFKPSGKGGTPAETRVANPLLTVRDANTLGIGGCERVSWTPLDTTVDRPKPSGICEEEEVEPDIARKC